MVFLSEALTQHKPISEMSKEEILQIDTDTLYNLPLEDIVAIANKLGVSINELMEMVTSTASRQVATIEEAPGIVTVIAKEQITNSSFRSLADALENVAGIYVIQDAEGKFSTCVRGTINQGTEDDFRTLVLIDGKPVYSFDQNYPLDYIERIEIVRGPSSALYGADAYSAVINIITLESSEDEDLSNISTAFGEHNTRKHQFSFKKYNSKNEISSLANATYYKSDGYPPKYNYKTGDLTNGLDNREYIDVFVKGRIKGLTIAGGYNQYKTNIYTKNDAKRINDRVTETKMASIDSDHDFIFGYLNTSIYFENYSDVLSEDHFKTSALKVYKHRKITEREFAKINGDFQFSTHPIADKHVITAGIAFNQHRHIKETEDRYFKKINSVPVDTIVTPDTTIIIYDYEVEERYQLRWLGYSQEDTIEMPFIRNTYAVYLQERYRILHNLIFTLGIRNDWNDQYGSEFTYKASINWQITPYIYTKAMYGRAFRAPFITETYMVFADKTNIGNPDLEVERVKTIEIQTGFNFNNKIRFSVDYYYNHLYNFIKTVGIKPDRSYQNTDDVINTQGVEFESEAVVCKGCRLMFNYSYVLARFDRDFPSHLSKSDLNKVRNVPGIPAHTANLQTFLNFFPIKNNNKLYRLNAYFGVNYVGERHRLYIYNKDEDVVEDLYHSEIENEELIPANNLKAYMKCNASISSYITKMISLEISANNLFDLKYFSPYYNQVYHDTPREDRYVQMSLKFEW